MTDMLHFMEQATENRIATIFNGTYTVHSRTGQHRTFSIRTVVGDPEDSAESFCNKFAGRRTISMLVGPDNSYSYKMFGWVDDDGIRLTGKFRDSEFHKRCAAIVWSLATEGEQSRYYVKGDRLLLEGRCIRCNRKLTTPQSISSGIGPVCAGRM